MVGDCPTSPAPTGPATGSAPSCLQCRHCGQSKYQGAIRCEHPSWEPEDEDMRWIDPVFASECSDYEQNPELTGSKSPVE